MAENGTQGAEEETAGEEKEATGSELGDGRSATGSQPDEDTAGTDECEWEACHKERFETAVFTLATFAAVFAVYIYIVYSLSSPPTVLHRM